MAGGQHLASSGLLNPAKEPQDEEEKKVEVDKIDSKMEKDKEYGNRLTVMVPKKNMSHARLATPVFDEFLRAFIVTI